MQYDVYIVRCADGTFYTGIAADVGHRIAEHNDGSSIGKGAKYTGMRQPVQPVYSAPFPDRSEATKEELCIKKLSQQKKGTLIAVE